MVIEYIKRGQVMGYEGDKLVYKYLLGTEDTTTEEQEELSFPDEVE